MTDTVPDPVYYLIPKEMLEGVLGYLGRRPYAEVAAAMRALEQLQPAPLSSQEDPAP